MNFWSNKKVFITGHTGFKGGWLSLWLQSLGAEVMGYALEPPTNPNLFQIANIQKDMHSIIGDIRNLITLKKTLKQFKPEIVIHMAAQPLVRYSYSNPVETYETNVMGTINLFEAVRATESVKVILNITSDKCYENSEIDQVFRESDPMGGYDPYSNSKGCAELISASYRLSFFNNKDNYIALATARSGNVIGGGDWAEDRLIPDFMRSIKREAPIVIRNPNAIRPWQHVFEPLQGYLNLAQGLYNDGAKYAESWNFGPDSSEAKTVLWVAERLTYLWGKEASIKIESSLTNHHEAHFLKLDCTKAKTQLNWHPKWGLETALDRICAWYKAYLNGEDMREYSLNEIIAYKLN